MKRIISDEGTASAVCYRAIGTYRTLIPACDADEQYDDCAVLCTSTAASALGFDRAERAKLKEIFRGEVLAEPVAALTAGPMLSARVVRENPLWTVQGAVERPGTGGGARTLRV